MKFRKNLGQYDYQYEGLVFAWEEKPCETSIDTVKMLSTNYHEHQDEIVRFMLPDSAETYSQVRVEDVKNNLGKPIIDYDNGKVFYCEQTFDDCHIFEFEFLDDAFQSLQYFSING